MLHPVYKDDGQVRQLTLEHLAAGRTVLQMFQLADNEHNHSLRVLEALGLPHGWVRVLSLGCGVGGMEAYWQMLHPEMIFEMVNISQAQLDLLVCHAHHKVCADITDYHVKSTLFDVTVLAYVLGHVDADKALATARANTRKGGVVLVLDACDGTEQFCSYFHYDTPGSEQLSRAGFVEVEQPHPWRLMPLIHQMSPWVTRHVTPGMWRRDV